MEAQQVVVMQAEASLEEEKIKNEEYIAVMRKYQERIDEMEVSFSHNFLFLEPRRDKILKNYGADYSDLSFVGSYEANGPKKRPWRKPS